VDNAPAVALDGAANLKKTICNHSVRPLITTRRGGGELAQAVNYFTLAKPPFEPLLGDGQISPH
jgi:hypothetical protein